MLEEKSEKNKKIISFFLNELSLLLKLEVDEIHDLCLLCTIILEDKESTNEIKTQAILILYNIAFLNMITLEEKWEIYWIIVEITFKNSKVKLSSGYIDILYEHIYNIVYNVLENEILKGEGLREKKEKIVVIVTSQFLSVGHAPTRRVLDYSYIIQNILNIPVLIINDSGNNIHNTKFIKRLWYFDYIEGFSEQETIFYKGTNFKFLQINSKMIDLNNILKMVLIIKEINPLLVFNVGGSSLVTDLCREFSKTATMPCSTEIPDSLSEYLIVGRKLREKDKERLIRMRPYQKIIESTFNYLMPKEFLVSYNREQFGIPEDSWLLVTAGNRLDQEMTDEFLEMIDYLLQKTDNIGFLVVGRVNENILKKFKKVDKVYLVGSLPDGALAIKLGNVFINPIRKGGGRAAFEALYYSIPVITTKYGDSWDVCGEEFEVDNYEEMKKKVELYYNDKTFYENMKNISKKRANILENMEDMIIKLFEKLEIEL